MRLIDADYLREQIQRKAESSYGLTRDVFVLMIKLLDVSGTVDAVEVIRCKDCIHFDGECCDRYADETLGYSHSTQPNFFCAVGERKTNDSQMQSDKIRQN